jgi:glycosyltransferase involved in cell wall biosynthesis
MDGVIVRYFQASWLRRLCWAPSLAQALEREIADADVIHLQSVFLWPTAIAARLARRAHVPYLLSPRGMLVRELLAHRHNLIKSLWISMIERQNLEAAASVHVTSNQEASDVASFGFSLSRLDVVPNGIPKITDRPSANPAADLARLTTMQPLLLSFGRISWKKGLERLLLAFAKTTTPKLAIVGTDDEGLTPTLLRKVAELGIADRVHIIPRTITGAEKEFVFETAATFVLASLSENFGNVVLEAMQRKLPVITTPAVGASEVVAAAGGGLVVKDDDISELSDAMESMARDEQKRQSLGKAGRDYVDKHYGWAVIAEQMEQIYRSIAEQSRRSRIVADFRNA